MSPMGRTVRHHTPGHNVSKYKKLDRQALLKAEYSPQAVPVQHFVNPGQLRYRNTTAASATKRMRLMHGSSLPGALPTHRDLDL